LKLESKLHFQIWLELWFKSFDGFCR